MRPTLHIGQYLHQYYDLLILLCGIRYLSSSSKDTCFFLFIYFNIPIDLFITFVHTNTSYDIVVPNSYKAKIAM